MTQVPFAPARRRILSAAAGTAVLGTGWVGSALAQAKEFKVGFFIALSGPASLFGPTQRACADHEKLVEVRRGDRQELQTL